MPNSSENYNLKLPLQNEYYDVDDFNSNFRIIDTELKKLEENKEPKINKKSGFNLDKTDIPENDSNKLITAKGALDLKNWIVTAYTNAINTTKSALESLIRNKLNHGGYGGTGQDLKNLVDSKEPKIKRSSSVTSTSETDVATSKAVKSANDNANGRISKSGDTMIGQLVVPNVKGVVTSPTTSSDGISSASISGESGWAILWRDNSDPNKSNEFLGIRNDSKAFFRKATGGGKNNFVDYELLHKGNATPEVIGALNSNGGKMLGKLEMLGNDIEFKASDCGDVVFYNTDGKEKGRIYTGITDNSLTIRGGDELNTNIRLENNLMSINASHININGKLFADKKRDTLPSISLAIGDTDTGFQWEADGTIAYMANGIKLFSLNSLLADYRLARAGVGSDWSKIPIPQIGSDGVVELGRYIDFHERSNDTIDYSCRLESSEGQLWLASLTSTSGVVLHTGNINSKYCPHRVGDVITTYNSSNPNTTWVGTSWTRVLIGRTPVGQDSGQTEFNTVGKQGGAKTHTLTLAQITPHNHTFVIRMDADEGGAGPYYGTPGNGHYGSQKTSNPTSNTGGGEPHNNLQPYEVVYFWKRTA